MENSTDSSRKLPILSVLSSFSILGAEKSRTRVMEIKRCTETIFLAEADLNYTILRLCGFIQD